MATSIANGEQRDSIRAKLNDIWAGLTLNEIAASKAVTAVDHIVYDTRFDSDGGAWRHRCQHTSWYSETLNTATRGSRREFPAVALIVAESNKVTIYDADDPTCPMWMVFENDNGQNNMIPTFSGTSLSSVEMLNGKLVVANGTFDTAIIDFLTDSEKLANSSIGALYKGNIEQRNDALGRTNGGGYAIVNRACNSVTMTVRPDAPIDPATGLPVPTIFVGTDGGWSQIGHDGTVYDFAFSTFPQVSGIHYDAERDLVCWNGASNAFSYDRGYFEHPRLTADKTGQAIGSFTGSAVYYDNNNPTNIWPAPYVAAGDGVSHSLSNVLASNIGLMFMHGIYENRVSSLKSSGMAAFMTSTYLTGWMVGDIKGAFLADTDATNLVGSGELVTNGTFDTDTTGWVDGSGGVGSWSSGVLRVTPASADTIGASYRTFTTAVGQTYTATIEVTANTATNKARWGVSTAPLTGFIYDSGTGVDVGTYAATFVATSTTTYINLISNTDGGGTQYTEFDNISVKLADPDRSVNGNGLVINGTITRTAVATGSELVAYSGFSAANYLEQPYNADLDFGTGDFCVMGWVKTTDASNNRQIFERQDVGVTGSGIKIRHLAATSDIKLAVTDDGGTTEDSVAWGRGINNGAWHFVCAGRSGSNFFMSIDGGARVNAAVSAASGSLNNSSAVTRVGKAISDGGSAGFDNGSLALLRIGATAPSAEQIAQIYEDEKFLFQENSDCTLYGSSDAVTALDRDPVTNLLHVGTSAGRSVIQGLRRVDNTTTAVTTAISAVDELVLEQ